jgi:voltage-gated potassium channel
MQALAELVHSAFHRPETTIYRWTNGLVWVLIVLSIGLFAVDLALGGLPETDLLVWVDRLILTFFGVEIALRILSFRPPVLEIMGDSRAVRLGTHLYARMVYALQPLNLIDILTVLAFFPVLRGLRALRMLRLLRASRFYKGPLRGTMRAFEDNALLYLFAFSTLGVLVLLGGTSMWLAERDLNPDVETLGDGIWWALVTITTVGFGDISPETAVGRGVASVLMIAGMFMLALFAGIVGHSLLNAVLSIREEQFRMSTNVNHLVICGWDSGSRMLLDTLAGEVDPERTDMVIFAPGTRPADLPTSFSWVGGDPTKESELQKIRLTHAQAVIVVGSRGRPPAEADAVTILTVFTVRRFLKAQKDTLRRKAPLRIIAEILDSENVEHCRTAGADEVIESTRLGFSLLSHAVVQPGTAEVLGEVVAAGAHSLYVGRCPAEQRLPMAFGELAVALKTRHGLMLLGVQDKHGKDLLNPVDSLTVTASMKLVYLAEEAVLPS